MKTHILTIAAILTLTSLSHAEEKKPPKPTVCLSYSIAKTDKSDDAVAICYDGEKPSFYYRFQVVEVPGKESGRIKVMVGWK